MKEITQQFEDRVMQAFQNAVNTQMALKGELTFACPDGPEEFCNIFAKFGKRVTYEKAQGDLENTYTFKWIIPVSRCASAQEA